MKHIEAWTISVCLYAIASAWGIASVLNEAFLLRRLQKLPNVPVISVRRLSVRLLIMLQSLTRLLWFVLGLAGGGSLDQRHSLLSCILDIIAWAFQFSALALITQYLCDVLHVNETGASNYVRFGSRRRKVYGASTVAVLVAIVMITVFAFVRAKDAYFAANCVSLCLCAGMSYLTLLLHRRVPVPKLLLLAGSCFFAFAVTVGNGLYIRASNGAFLPSTVNDIIYPWFIYQVPDLLPDLVILVCFMASADRQSRAAQEESVTPSPLLGTSQRSEQINHEGSLTDTLLPISSATSDCSFSTQSLNGDAGES